MTKASRLRRTFRGARPEGCPPARSAPGTDPAQPRPAWCGAGAARPNAPNTHGAWPWKTRRARGIIPSGGIKMIDIRSWRVWVIVALRLAIARLRGRGAAPEREERGEKSERMEQRRGEREEQLSAANPRRAARETAAGEPKVLSRPSAHRGVSDTGQAATRSLADLTARTAREGVRRAVSLRAPTGRSVDASSFGVNDCTSSRSEPVRQSKRSVRQGRAMNTPSWWSGGCGVHAGRRVAGKSYYALLLPRQRGVSSPSWSLHAAGNDLMCRWDKEHAPDQLTAANARMGRKEEAHSGVTASESATGRS